MAISGPARLVLRRFRAVRICGRVPLRLSSAERKDAAGSALPPAEGKEPTTLYDKGGTIITLLR